MNFVIDKNKIEKKIIMRMFDDDDKIKTGIKD